MDDKRPLTADIDATELDQLAWGFLGSEFAGSTYAVWPINRRVDAYLLRRGLAELANDGSRCNALVHHIMANIGHARRNGTLPETP